MFVQSIFSVLILGIFLFIIIEKNFYKVIIGSLSSGIAFIISCIKLYEYFNCKNFSIKETSFILNVDFGFINKTLEFGIYDINSLYFITLSTFLIFCCIIKSIKSFNKRNYNDTFIFKNEIFLLLIIDLLLLIIFLTYNLALFYIFFEAILIPMYLLIGTGGSRERKIHAAYMFFFYTLCSSLLFLLGILYIYFTVGSLDYDYIFSHTFSPIEQKILWLTFFLSFASKIPMYPFHIWLPEAHVEAPTVGSVILAGILLKLGVYGMLRFSLTLFPYASLYFSPLVYLLSTIGIVYASMTAIRQTDLKRIIAYSSVAHMNVVTLGLFSFNSIGIEGAILQSLSHGFVSGGMFLLIGILYDRYHSRFLYYYGGLVHMMPFFAIFLLIFTLANIALPSTSSFVGEFLLLTGIYKTNVFVAAIGALGVILCGGYSLWLYNRVIFGNLKIDHTLKFKDMTLHEILVLLPLLILIFFMGIYPKIFSTFISYSSSVFIFVTM